MNLADIGTYTGREPLSETAGTQLNVGPGENGTQTQTAEPPPQPVQETAKDSSSQDLLSDLSAQFAKNIGEPSTATPEEPAKSEEPVKEPPREKTWRDAEPPPNVTKKVQEDWRSFKEKAKADVDARDARIKALEQEITSYKDTIPKSQAESDRLKKELSDSQAIVERVAIERSPLFKSKILDQEEALKGRLAKVLDGTGLTPQEAALLMTGNLTVRENLLENRQMSAFRKQQIADILDKWDAVAEEKERLTSRGRDSLNQFFEEQRQQIESNKAQFVRESEKVFTDQEALCHPKLEVYQKTDNADWNAHVDALKLVAHRIYNGQVPREQLAQAAILAPAAIIYQNLLHAAQKQITDLKTQVDTLRGVSPQIRDSGADTPTPGAPAKSLSSPNGDFVKDLVSKFQKSTGMS